MTDDASRLPASPLKQRFFDGYVRFHPEEATTLGLREGRDRLRDHSPASLDEEHRWLKSIAAQLDDADDDLDTLCMRRLVSFHLHAWPRLYSTIDWSLYPYSIIQIQRVHAEDDEDRRAIQRRLADVPRFLEQQEALLSGAKPDRVQRAFLVETLLPRAIAGIRDEGVRRAYEKHRAFVANLETSDSAALGEEELRWRLIHMLGIDEAPSSLVRRARDDLAATQEKLIATAADVAPARKIVDLAGARALTLEMQEDTLADGVDPAAFYRGYIERARTACTDMGLFDIDDDYVIGIEPLPPGLDVFVSGTNWPAPLKAQGKLGHFVVSTDPRAHSTAWAADLAVHEGLPGHHFQSFHWQRLFHDDPAPVRFLVVHDQIAIPRNYWAPMLNIEGWAVYVEEVMRGAGYFTKAEELFVLMAHGVRIARVVCDVSLHAGTMRPDEARAFLRREACLNESDAALEVRRYLQTPLQASTYHLGRTAIEALAAGAPNLAAFHRWFLGFGPVDPRALHDRANRPGDLPGRRPQGRREGRGSHR